MEKILFALLLMVSFAATAFATPVMQVGVPDGSGSYVANTVSSSDPTETDTAITSGDKIAVAAEYDKVGNNPILHIGGQYTDGTLTGPNWGSVGGRTAFNGYGAVLLAAVPHGSGSNAYTTLKVNNALAFSWNDSDSYFGDNHDPLKAATSDFLFFDIGEFFNTGDVVPNFQDSGTTLKPGEVKTLTLSGMGDLAWIHFDVMALLSYYDANADKIIFINSDYGDNPGSKDVTWKNPGGGGGGQGSPVPEPSTLILLGAGIAGLAVFRRKKG